MDDGAAGPDGFSISRGGPTYRLLTRGRLVSNSRHYVDRRIALAVSVTWLPLFVLSGWQGTLVGGEADVPFLHDPNPYTRFLLALPLLVLAEVVVDPLLGAVVNHLRTSGVLPDDARARFDAALKEAVGRRDSGVAELAMLVLALTMAFVFKSGYDDDVTGDYVSWLFSVENGVQDVSPAGWWYIFIASPLMQFMLYRWLWRYGIWVAFLFDVSRIRLNLQPAHADQAGGLGILSTGQAAFVPVFVALSIMMSGTIAYDILHEGHTLEGVRMTVAGLVIVVLLVLEGPLFLFFMHMVKARQRGLRDYGALGYRLSHAFQRKWIGPAPMQQGGELMESVDSSSMADYIATYDAVRSMRVVPMSLRGLVTIAALAAAPFLPLVLTEVSFNEAMQRLFNALV